MVSAMGSGYKRLLAPPDYRRRVDVPDELVEENLRRGFRIDPVPDDRPALAASLAGSLAGGFAFCMASGPSMAAWPREMIAELASACTCWATNNAYEVCGGLPVPACRYLVVLDRDFWEVHREKVRAFVAASGAVPCLCFQPSESVRYLELPISLSRTPDTDPSYEPGRYWHGNSSGVAAVQMALHARPRAIFLLGHDCSVAAGRTHGNGVRSHEELVRKYPQGSSMLPSYAVLARHAKQLGVEMYNLSPWSAVKDFPVIGLPRALEIVRCDPAPGGSP